MIINYNKSNEFCVNQRVEYLGCLYEKHSICTITKVVKARHRIYYSVLFDSASKEVNYILPIVLRKIDNESEEINNG